MNSSREATERLTLQQLEEYMDWLDEVFPEHEPFVVDLLPGEGEEDEPAVLMWEDDTDA